MIESRTTLFIIQTLMCVGCNCCFSPPPAEEIVKFKKEGMRLCAHVRCYLVSANTCEETEVMEHISRLKICYRDIAYTFKRKHTCSVPPLEILPISIAGQYCNALLAYCFRSRKQVQKYEKVSNTQNYFAILKKRRTFAVEKNEIIYRKIE
jgi:hypothetical protein